MLTQAIEPARTFPPRLGFLGVGWIGRNRMDAVARSGAGLVSAIVDPSDECAGAALAAASGASRAASLDALLEQPLDGIVIATPSALHAEQAVRALEAGIPVFCQKPLGRTALETSRVVDAGRAANLLLGVDLSYRHTAAMQAVRNAVRQGEIGTVYAADLAFHNAWAPGHSWCYDPRLAGGGCVIDLGIHLVDLVLWTLDWPDVRTVESRLFHRGTPMNPRAADRVEDYAIATLDLDGGAAVRVACSWNLSIGQDAHIEAVFHGTDGSAAFRNVNGSFHDFRADVQHAASREQRVAPPDEWGGRAIVEWARRVAAGERYDPAIRSIIDVAGVLDRMLRR